MENKKLLYMTIAYDLYKNKINGQIAAWERKGYTCDLLFLHQSSSRDGLYDVVFCEKGIEGTQKVIIEKKRKVDAIRKMFKYMKSWSKNYNNIYIRRFGINVILGGMCFSKCKGKIIYEIPTYPIDSGTSFVRKIILGLEKIFFYLFVYQNVVIIPACVQRKSKCPKKLLQIDNAVDCKEINYEQRKDNGKYSFVFIGNIQPWHGIEKFINELMCYKKEDIELKIFSPNTEYYCNLKSKYTSIVNIKFCGMISMHEIDPILSKNTIGIGGLDYNSRGAEFDTSLKNKDYASLGIPFVYSLTDLSFVNYAYALQLKEEDYNGKLICNIISWYEQIQKDGLSYEIWMYAKENLTYDKQIERIIGRMLEWNML